MTSRSSLAFVRRVVVAVVLLSGLLTASLLAQKTVHVKGYVRKDGTVVKPHERQAPGSKAPVATKPTEPTPTKPTPPAPTAAVAPAMVSTPSAGVPPIAPVVSAEDDPRATVTANAAIYLVPDSNRTPLRTAAINTTLRVLETNGEWLKVEFQDPQYGRRQGYVQAKNVRVLGSALQPMDLSIPPPQLPAERPQVVPAVRPAATPPPVALTGLSSAPIASAVPTVADTVYVTKTGAKYHRAGCRSLAKSAIPMKLADAARVYGPCSICRP